MLKHHIHFQISTQIDRLLNKKIPADLLPLCVSDYPAPGVLHDQALTALRAWCRKAKIELKADDFEKNLQKKTFKNKLQACFNLGYFLNAGYGGVKLWTLQDEYTLLAAPDNKVLKRSKTKAPKIRKLTEDQKFWMEAAKHFSEVRDRRKSLQQHTFYRMAQILEEIGKIVGIARSELECLRIEEFKKEFLTNQAVKTFIAERKNGYLGFWAPAVGTWEWNGRTAEDGYAQIAKKYQTVKEIKGNCACPGKAQGKVRVVLNPRLQEKFEEGEILVAGMTSPDYVPFMKKAAAIVTELGGITCHAAIISRELNIPCVIGTNIATKVLKDGDLVEVDANNGVVRILK
jgi:phosphoenolpyruvate synthase/pyruvate phosphate dikinase